MEKSTLKNQVASGAIWKFADVLSTKLITFIVSIVIARILLPSDYGIVAMASIFITIADVFVANGLNTSLVQKKDADNKDFSTIFYCSMILAISLYLLIFITAPLIATFYNQDLLTILLRIMGLKLPIQAFNAIQQAKVARELQFKKYFWSSLGGTLASGVVGIAMAYSGYGVWALVGQQFTDVFIDSFIMLFTIKWFPTREFSYDRAKPLVSYGWKVLAANLIGTLFNQLSSFIIGKKYTSSDLAYYNKGQNIPQMISNQLQTTVSGVLFPAMAKVSDDKSAVNKICSRSIQIMSYILFPIMTGLIISSKYIIRFLLTDKWLLAVPYMQIMCVSGMIETLESIAGVQALKAVGRSDVALRIEFIKKPIYLLALFIAIPFGVKAIAITTPICSGIAVLINITSASKYTGYSIKDAMMDISLPLLLSGIMALVLMAEKILVLNDLLMIILMAASGIFTYFMFSKILHVKIYDYVVDLAKNMLHSK